MMAMKLILSMVVGRGLVGDSCDCVIMLKRIRERLKEIFG